MDERYEEIIEFAELEEFQDHMFKQLSSGMGITLEIFFVTLVTSLILGLALALIRMSKIQILSLLAKIYISIMRGTPLMLQLLVVYFGPYFIFGIQITRTYRLTAVLIGFSLNYAAYFAEIYRAGISAIPEGQYEAAKLLGYSKLQTFVHIIMPQVIKRIIPPVANETITLVKDTSLAFTLAVAEVFTLTKQLVAAESSMIPFVVAGVFYYIFNLLVALFFDYLEKRLSYYR